MARLPLSNYGHIKHLANVTKLVLQKCDIFLEAM